MKINAGLLRGMGIIMPKNQMTRPTLSRVREAVFNILMHDVSDCVFWDLFAGSGAVGLNALSLGARECIFVEADKSAAQALKLNLDQAKSRLEKQNQDSHFRLLAQSFESAWGQLQASTPPNIVWADPPYTDSKKWTSFLLQELPSQMQSDGLLLIEMNTPTSRELEQTDLLTHPQWQLIKVRAYGDSSIVIWRKL